MGKTIDFRTLIKRGYSNVLLEVLSEKDDEVHLYFYSNKNTAVDLVTGATVDITSIGSAFYLYDTRKEVLEKLLKYEAIDRSGFLLVVRTIDGRTSEYGIPFSVFDITPDNVELAQDYIDILTSMPAKISSCMNNSQACVRILTKYNNVVCLNTFTTLSISVSPLLKKCANDAFASFRI